MRYQAKQVYTRVSSVVMAGLRKHASMSGRLLRVVFDEAVQQFCLISDKGSRDSIARYTAHLQQLEVQLIGVTTQLNPNNVEKIHEISERLGVKKQILLGAAAHDFWQNLTKDTLK